MFVLSTILSIAAESNSTGFPSVPLNFSERYLISGSFSLLLIVEISLANADSPRLIRALFLTLITDWIPADNLSKSLVSQSFGFLDKTDAASTKPIALNAFPNGTATLVTAFATFAIFPVAPRYGTKDTKSSPVANAAWPQSPASLWPLRSFAADKNNPVEPNPETAPTTEPPGTNPAIAPAISIAAAVISFWSAGVSVSQILEACANGVSSWTDCSSTSFGATDNLLPICNLNGSGFNSTLPPCFLEIGIPFWYWGGINGPFGSKLLTLKRPLKVPCSIWLWLGLLPSRIHSTKSLSNGVISPLPCLLQKLPCLSSNIW